MCSMLVASRWRLDGAGAQQAGHVCRVDESELGAAVVAVEWQLHAVDLCPSDSARALRRVGESRLVRSGETKRMEAVVGSGERRSVGMKWMWFSRFVTVGLVFSLPPVVMRLCQTTELDWYDKLSLLMGILAVFLCNVQQCFKSESE